MSRRSASCCTGSALLLILLAAPLPALAQMELGTPDGQPPSIETVCDGQVGAAFGLCNAYCEAMDCDSDNALADQTACDRVRDKFMNVTGEEMPCELACPCIDANTAWATMVANPDTITSCDAVTQSGNFLGIGARLIDGTAPIGYDGAVPVGAFPANACGEFFGQQLVPLTASEARACQDYLRSLAESVLGAGTCPVETREPAD